MSEDLDNNLTVTAAVFSLDFNLLWKSWNQVISIYNKI